MPWQDDLKLVVARTKNTHYEILTADDHPDHEIWRARMTEKVTGVRAPASLPPVGIQIGTALGALGRAAAASLTGQFVWVPPEILDERRSECVVCPHLVNDRCKLCGCYYATKIRLATESCPATPKKWTAYTAE
jgi:hypothetical protein